MSGLRLITMAEPTRPTADERRKPGFERSIKYHRKGFTRARLNETCIVDAHCVFRCQ
jgi:NAD-dependent dihydropyrimidine dehydrogenase PreA subunit